MYIYLCIYLFMSLYAYIYKYIYIYVRGVWVAAPQGSGAGLVPHLHTSVTYCPGMLHISSKSFFQQVNGEGLRTSNAGCPDLQLIAPPYAGSPVIEHISIPSSQQVLFAVHRTSSPGCPDLQRIDILYADFPVPLLFTSAISQQHNLEGLRSSSAHSPDLQPIHLLDAH